MLTIQLKVERETANPIRAMKGIDLGLRTATSARREARLLSPEREERAHVAKLPAHV